MRISAIYTSIVDSTSAHYTNTNIQLSLQPLHNQLSTQIKRRHALLIFVVAACLRMPECGPHFKPMSYVCHIMSCACVNDFFHIFSFSFFFLTRCRRPARSSRASISELKRTNEFVLSLPFCVYHTYLLAARM